MRNIESKKYIKGYMKNFTNMKKSHLFNLFKMTQQMKNEFG